MSFRVGGGGEARGCGVVWDIGVGEFELGLLFECSIGGREVCGKCVCEVLLVFLFNGGWKGLESIENVVGNTKSDGRFGLERFRKPNKVILRGSASSLALLLHLSELLNVSL